jgi:hypothetical protein
MPLGVAVGEVVISRALEALQRGFVCDHVNQEWSNSTPSPEDRTRHS